MNKASIVAFLLIAIATTAYAQQCDSNSEAERIRAGLGITSLTNPQAVTGLKYCTYLEGEEACCSADVINAFQEETDNLLERLREAVVARDTFLLKEAGNDLMIANMNKIKAVAEKAIAVLGEQVDDSEAAADEEAEAMEGMECTLGCMLEADPAACMLECLGQEEGEEEEGEEEGMEGMECTMGCMLEADPAACMLECLGQEEGEEGQEEIACTMGCMLEADPAACMIECLGQEGEEEALPGDGGNPEDFINLIKVQGVIQILNILKTFSDQLEEFYPQAKETLSTYQSSRAECIIEMVNVQAAAACFACGEPAAQTGFTPLSLTTDACSAIKDKCHNFLTTADAQSALLYVNFVIGGLINAVAEPLQNIAAGKDIIANVDELLAFSESFTAASPTSEDETPVELPNGCDTKEGCNWLCENLFNTGLVDLELLVAGGVTRSMENDRLLASVSNGRALQTEWNPEDTSAGVSVTFPADPAGLNNAMRLVANGALFCLSALFLALFI